MRSMYGLPGAGNGGMAQLTLTGKVSMFVSVPNPPLIVRPVLKTVRETDIFVPGFRNNP